MSWLKVSVVSVLMLMTATLAVWATPTDYLVNIKPREPLTKVIKPAIGNWQLDPTSHVLITSAVLDEKLASAYTDVISETYFNKENQKVMLSVAYSDNQRNGLAVHLPEACYPAQGFEILEKRELPVTLNNGRQLNLTYMKTKRGSRVEPLVYWTMAGETLYRNDFERKQVSIKYALDNIIPDGLVFRVSTISADDEMALDMITDFVRDFDSSLAESDKPRFFGTELAQLQ
ncbi:exosortase C-terminal domain/associated protein EpsI [Methylophaga sp. OBS3]|uniref:exosortase C-terminal domain/associated protein EpsI n=1 Tax=Methylophaga sp. OBS3 TaxID=2991934 RepID=UPI002255A732|nr:exosortase C-terminal domain/associated protein EpsI [Methylophaga sp. OBS3]MCX4189092.1 EpsI family protein [Methylophaga sp. OBS3]